jgi:hypothetical protein
MQPPSPLSGSPGDPPTGPPAGPDLETVLETADLAMLAVVKSLLESAGIPYVVQGDQALGLIPLSGPAFGTTRPPFQALVLVPKEHAAAAREILRGEGDME